MSNDAADPGTAEMPHDPDWEVTVAQADALRKCDGVSLFLDVRTPAELETAAIDGATAVPMSDIPEVVERLAEHQQGKVVVFCHHGGRSLRVTQFLRQQGFTDAWSMAGGIDAWSRIVDSAVPRY